MKTTETTVSVIMACYNKQGFIFDSVLSVLNQTVQNFEFIIIDDGSTDSSGQILKNFAKNDNRIIFIQNSKNAGANYCRNLGLRKSTAEFVLFFDADDQLAPNCIESRLLVHAQTVDLDFSIHTMQVFKLVPGDCKKNWVPTSRTLLVDFLKHDLPFQTMQPLWRRKTILKVGGWDESLVRLQDVDLHTRVLLLPELKYKAVKALPDCYYRVGEDRKNYNNADFFQRWINGSIDYCTKFFAVLSKENRSYLIGTVFQTYVSLLLAYRNGNLTESQFNDCEKKILNQKVLSGNLLMVGGLFRLAKSYNLSSPRIPGLNRLLKFIILFVQKNSDERLHY